MADLDPQYGVHDRSLAIVNHVNGTLVALAGPGTGKTYSLLQRAGALVDQGHAPETICYLTFIKEIANAFRDDYIQQFGQEVYDLNHPRIQTLHSFACRILRNQGFRIGYDGDLFFANATDRQDIAMLLLLSDLLPRITREDCRTVPQIRNHINDVKRAGEIGVTRMRCLKL